MAKDIAGETVDRMNALDNAGPTSTGDGFFEPYIYHPDHEAALEATRRPLLAEIRHLNVRLAAADARNADLASKVAILEDRVAVLKRSREELTLAGLGNLRQPRLLS